MGWFRGVLVWVVSVVAGVGLAGSGVAVSPVWGAEGAGTVAGVFGGGALVGFDDRTGQVSGGFPVGLLPGVAGVGGTQVSVSYAQERAGLGDVSGLGAGWDFGVTRVDVSGDTPRVFPSGGGVFDADASWGSGLARYPGEDLKFMSNPGILNTPEGAINYTFMLTTGTGSEYFSANGFLLAQADLFGNVTRWVWDETTGRLLSVTDPAGNQLGFEWTDSSIRVRAPQRADGVPTPDVVIEKTSEGVVSVTDTAGESVTFGYEPAGLLAEARSSTGTVTRVSYQPVGAEGVGVDTVVVRDFDGRELSRQTWDPVGENVFTGFPKTLLGEDALWSSGDGEFRYTTRVSDGTTSIAQVFNSLGLVVERSMTVSTPSGEVPVRGEQFVYDGTQEGGVPAAGSVPPHYNTPIEQVAVFRNGSQSRTVTETTEYDDKGRPVSHTDPTGAVTTTIYDDTPVGGAQLPSGLVTKQTVTGVDGTVSVTVNTPNPTHTSIAVTETFTGTTNEPLASTTRTSVVTEADGFVSEKTVSPTPSANATGGVESVTTRWVREINRDARTVRVSETSAAGTDVQSSTSIVGDLGSGLVLENTDAAGGVTKTTYDGAGSPVDVIDPAGRVTVLSHGDHGRVSRVTGPDGVRTSTYRDVLGNTVKTTTNVTQGSNGEPALSPDPLFERVVETREYADNYSKVTVTDALGRKGVSVRDVFGRPRLASLENGLTQVSEYDDVANTVTTGVSASPEHGLAGAVRTTTTRLDNAGRNIATTGARQDGVPVPEATNVFDGLGRVINTVAGDIASSVVLNPDGTPRTTMTTPVNPAFSGETVTATRTHDLMGASTNKTLTRKKTGSVLDATVDPGASERGEGVTRRLDEAGRVSWVKDQAGGITRYTHTIDGLVAEVVEETSRTITRNTYDPVTRLVTGTVTSRPGMAQVRKAFEYDVRTGNLLSVFDPEDRAATQITYAYDVLGNTTSVGYPDGKTISHVFDVNGQKTHTTDSVGNTTTYTYNDLGLLEAAIQNNNAGDQIARVAYDYDGFGRATRLTRGNGVTTEYTFTSANEIQTEKTVDGHGDMIFEGSYVYDTHGNLSRKTVTGRHADTPALVTQTTMYAYNAYNQLTDSRVYNDTETSGTPVTHTRYAIGVTGNITKETTTTGMSVTVREFEYNTLGQTTAVITDGVRAEQSYDAAGNLLCSADGTRYEYTADNRPVSTTRADGAVSESTYWVDGTRKNVTDQAGEKTVTTGFYWDGDAISNETLEEKTGDSSELKVSTSAYLFGSSRVARTINSTTRVPENESSNENASPTNGVEYFVSDRHGNTTSLTTPTGTVSISYTYSDYGNTVTHGNHATTGNRFQYSSEYVNPIDGTQELGVRRYAPTSFGFTTRDTAPLYNLYAYADSNPVTLADPSGQSSVTDTIVNGVTLGISVIGLVLTGITAAVAYTAKAWRTLAATLVGGAMDATGETMANLAHANNHWQPFMNDTTSQALTWTGLALSITGSTINAGLATKARKTSGNTMDAPAGQPGPSNLIEALEFFPDTLEGNLRLSAWRARYRKDGSDRIQYHGTDLPSQNSILDPKIGVAIPAEIRNGRAYGNGFYGTWDSRVGEKYKRDTTRKTGNAAGGVQFVVNSQYAVKVTHRTRMKRHDLIIKNPRYHRQAAPGTSREFVQLSGAGSLSADNIVGRISREHSFAIDTVLFGIEGHERTAVIANPAIITGLSAW